MQVLHVLPHAVLEGLVISILIFLMMLVIDYVNVATRGRFSLKMRGGRFRQYVTASILGASPGCLGAFLSVTLYIHGLLSFGGITAAAVATAGDETFLMLALFPGKAVALMVGLAVLGVAAGALADLLVAGFKLKVCETCREQRVHEHPHCVVFKRELLWRQLLHPRAKRLVLIGTLALGLALLVAQVVGHPGWNAWRVVFVTLSVAGILIGATVPDQYLEEHVWSHLVRRHLPQVAVWTTFALVLVAVASTHWNVKSLIAANRFLVLLGAIAVGFIPTSGPHMVFVNLFARGAAPFSVLLANSIVQDGHGLLPLLGSSVSDVVRIKAYKALLAMAVAGPLLLLGW